MKKFAIIFSLLLQIHFLLHSQDTIPLVYDYFEDRYDGNPDFGTSVISWNGNILRMGIVVYNDDNYRGISLTCIDTLGHDPYNNFTLDLDRYSEDTLLMLSVWQKDFLSRNPVEYGTPPSRLCEKLRFLCLIPRNSQHGVAENKLIVN